MDYELGTAGMLALQMLTGDGMEDRWTDALAAGGPRVGTCTEISVREPNTTRVEVPESVAEAVLAPLGGDRAVRVPIRRHVQRSRVLPSFATSRGTLGTRRLLRWSGQGRYLRKGAGRSQAFCARTGVVEQGLAGPVR